MLRRYRPAVRRQFPAVKRLIPFLAIVVLALGGCAKDNETVAISTPPASSPHPTTTVPPNPSADPVVVNAEKTLAAARDTFKFIEHQERQNRAVFDKISTKIHPFVEYVRRNDVQWLRTAEAMKTAYKTNRSPENRANLLTAISTVSQALEQSKQYLLQAGYGNQQP